MATRHSATLVISGSVAALSMTVVPLASVAAIMMVWVAPTETRGRSTLPPTKTAGRRLGDDIALVDVDLGAELPEAVQEEVHRTRTDGAAAGQRHARLVHAGKKRSDDPEAGAHGRNQLIGRAGVDDLGGGQRHLLAAVVAIDRAAGMNADIDAVILQNALELEHVGQTRHIVEDQRFARQKRCDHQRQRGVLGARNRDGPVQRVLAPQSDLVHERSLSELSVA